MPWRPAAGAAPQYLCLVDLIQSSLLSSSSWLQKKKSSDGAVRGDCRGGAGGQRVRSALVPACRAAPHAQAHQVRRRAEGKKKEEENG